MAEDNFGIWLSEMGKMGHENVFDQKVKILC